MENHENTQKKMPLIIEYAINAPEKLKELLTNITQKVMRSARKEKRKSNSPKSKITPMITLNKFARKK